MLLSGLCCVTISALVRVVLCYCALVRVVVLCYY